MRGTAHSGGRGHFASESRGRFRVPFHPGRPRLLPKAPRKEHGHAPTPQQEVRPPRSHWYRAVPVRDRGVGAKVVDHEADVGAEGFVTASGELLLVARVQEDRESLIIDPATRRHVSELAEEIANVTGLPVPEPEVPLEQIAAVVRPSADGQERSRRMKRDVVDREPSSVEHGEPILEGSVVETQAMPDAVAFVQTDSLRSHRPRTRYLDSARLTTLERLKAPGSRRHTAPDSRIRRRSRACRFASSRSLLARCRSVLPRPNAGRSRGRCSTRRTSLRPQRP